MAEQQTPSTLVDVLDDLTVRFLLNLPASELSSVPRLCFQVEEAQWYYEDFIRPAVVASGRPPLPNLPLRQFCLLLFQHCPLFSGYTDSQHLAAYEEFLAYKVRVPVRGAILMDKNMEKLVLVRGWKKGASWSFPRGKINKDEKDLDCAIREVYEETGYDVRASGLVPAKELEAKYIDITMREQHMRLFVFRGVPEDTYFEPKTRKEISKIAWYNIKDLPGFKKGRLEGGESSNKFYMVAPFLGPLKKWIGQQRRLDAEDMSTRVQRDGYAYAAQTGTEDESEDQMPVRVEPNRTAGDLKETMTSIGRDAAAKKADMEQEPAKPGHSAGDLLAMLQASAKPANGRQAPHTPFEQMNAFPQQPESPQPNHMRRVPTGPQQVVPPPQFPWSPPRMQQAQQEQRNSSLPTPNIFGPPGNFPPHQKPPALQATSPQPYWHSQPSHRNQSMPGPPPGVPFPQHNGMPFNGPLRPLMQPPHMLPAHMQQQQQQQPPHNAFMAQGQQGAIASGPAVPNASQLPPPRLNPQSMKLLNAFKSGNQSTAQSHASEAPQVQRPASAHQTALLNLFRKPSTSESAAASPSVAVPEEVVQEPLSPTGTDVTVKPTKTRRERKSTLNEITRTLPMKMKAKSPPPPPQQPQAPVQLREVPQAQNQERPKSRQLIDPAPAESREAPQVQSQERPKSRQLFDPISGQMKPVPTTKDAQARTPRAEVPHSNLQQPQSRQRTSRSPRPKDIITSSSPSRKQTDAKANGERPPPPTFTILARPGSAKGPQSPAIATESAPPQSPLRNEASKTPQLLQRPKAAAEIGNQSADKKDHLLALFGKASPSQPAPVVEEQQAQPEDVHKSSLLNLFSNTTSPQPTASPEPPRAPRIEPEHRPQSSRTSMHHQPTASRQQSLLLDLFGKKEDAGSPVARSPGTPISPFTLGTPATTQPERSRLGSVSSSGGGGGGGTPVEAKDKEFLMDFLHGVVMKEGYRGATGGRM